MPSGILGQYYLSLVINGYELPIAPPLIHKLEIIEHYKNALPTMALSFVDPTGRMIRDNPIVDGSPIDVALGKNPNDFVTPTRFICYGSPSIKVAPQGSFIELQAMLDKPKYIAGQCQQAISGTSTAALQQIANECGLTFKGIGTNDFMHWLPQLTQFVKQASYIADHGFAGSSSAMNLGVTEQGELRYMDMMQLAGMSGSRTITYGPAKKDLQALDWSAENLSGLSNYFTGYGLQVYQENLIKGAMDSFMGNFATRMSSFFNISSNIMKTLNGVATRIEKFPIQIGNVHDNFEKAEQQNRRLLGMFSVFLTTMIEDVSNLNLFDSFNFELYDNPTREYNSTYSGSYIVCAKTRALISTRYVEKVTGMTSGMNAGNGM